jgi:hypothetical protein
MKVTHLKPTRKKISPLLHLAELLYRHRYTIADGLQFALEVLRNWPPPSADPGQGREKKTAPGARKRLAKGRACVHKNSDENCRG